MHADRSKHAAPRAPRWRRMGGRLGAAAFAFFLVKGLIWVAVAYAGYSALAG